MLLSLPLLLLPLAPVADADRDDERNRTPNEEGVVPRCEAAIDQAAGKFSRCLLKASAKFARNDDTDGLAANQAKCEDRFNENFDEARARFRDDCTDLREPIFDRTTAYAEAVALEAGGTPAASRLYFQSATGGMLTESNVTLTGVDPQTGWFTDRPYRQAGQITTAEFVALFFEEGANSFAIDAPNADFTCASGGEVVNHVVTLTDPVLDEAAHTLTYDVTLVPSGGPDDSVLEVTCDEDVRLFIDSEAAVASASSTPSTYNCFVGGFCSQAAIDYPPDELGYQNIYEGDHYTIGAALEAGCGESTASGAGAWFTGRETVATQEGSACGTPPCFTILCSSR